MRWDILLLGTLDLQLIILICIVAYYIINKAEEYSEGGPAPEYDEHVNCRCAIGGVKNPDEIPGYKEA